MCTFDEIPAVVFDLSDKEFGGDFNFLVCKIVDEVGGIKLTICLKNKHVFPYHLTILNLIKNKIAKGFHCECLCEGTIRVVNVTKTIYLKKEKSVLEINLDLNLDKVMIMLKGIFPDFEIS